MIVKALAVCTALAASSLGGCMTAGNGYGYHSGSGYGPTAAVVVEDEAPIQMASCASYGGCGGTIAPPRYRPGPGYGRPGYTAQPRRVLLPNPGASMPGAYRCTDPQTGESGYCVPRG